MLNDTTRIQPAKSKWCKALQDKNLVSSKYSSQGKREKENEQAGDNKKRITSTNSICGPYLNPSSKQNILKIL